MYLFYFWQVHTTFIYIYFFGCASLHCWHRLSLFAESGATLSLWGFSCLQSRGSRCMGFSSCGSQTQLLLRHQSPRNYSQRSQKNKSTQSPKLHTTWFHLYNILKWKKLKEMKNRLVLPWLGIQAMGEECLSYKAAAGGIFGDQTFLDVWQNSYMNLHTGQYCTGLHTDTNSAYKTGKHWIMIISMPTLWFCTTILYYGYTRCYHRGSFRWSLHSFCNFLCLWLFPNTMLFLKKRYQASVQSPNHVPSKRHQSLKETGSHIELSLHRDGLQSTATIL